MSVNGCTIIVMEGLAVGEEEGFNEGTRLVVSLGRLDGVLEGG
jgi:hypothetical protein